jgi:MFS family permease
VVITEEVRRERRGAALSLVGLISFLGPGLTALAILLVPLTPLDWRIFYLIALPPLFVIAYLRRNLGRPRRSPWRRPRPGSSRP